MPLQKDNIIIIKGSDHWSDDENIPSLLFDDDDDDGCLADDEDIDLVDDENIVLIEPENNSKNRKRKRNIMSADEGVEYTQRTKRRKLNIICSGLTTIYT